jgi:hypothetical protein
MLASEAASCLLDSPADGWELGGDFRRVLYARRERRVVGVIFLCSWFTRVDQIAAHPFAWQMHCLAPPRIERTNTRVAGFELWTV